MFILSDFTSWQTTKGYSYYWSKVCNVGENDDFCCYVLDTNDMSNERFTREELEVVLKRCPSIEIQGVRHSNGKVTGIYNYRGGGCSLSGDYALVHEKFISGGNYMRCRLYKRGVGLIYKWDTPHYEYFDWEVSLRVNKKLITIKETVVMRYKGKDDLVFDMVLRDDINGIKVIRVPTDEEVNQGFQFTNVDPVYFEGLVKDLKNNTDYCEEALKYYLLRLRKGVKISIICIADSGEIRYSITKTGIMEYSITNSTSISEGYASYIDLVSYIGSLLNKYKIKSLEIKER